VFFSPSGLHSRPHLPHQCLPEFLSFGGRRDTEGHKSGKKRLAEKLGNRNDCVIQEAECKQQKLNMTDLSRKFVFKINLEGHWEEGEPGGGSGGSQEEVIMGGLSRSLQQTCSSSLPGITSKPYQVLTLLSTQIPERELQKCKACPLLREGEGTFISLLAHGYSAGGRWYP
jgi:hypothetical protein